MENHVLEKIHLHGTILFYNRRMGKRLQYSPVKATLAVLAAAALYVVFVLANRWFDDRHAATKARSQMDRKNSLPPELATSEMKVLQFYASPPVVKAGQQGLICYGVLNAKTARIDPDPGETTPALSRCLAVTPRRSTSYTLTIDDGRGRKLTATTEVRIE